MKYEDLRYDKKKHGSCTSHGAEMVQFEAGHGMHSVLGSLQTKLETLTAK